MTKKEILRKVLFVVINLFCILYVTANFLRGRANVFAIIGMVILYVGWILFFILHIIYRIGGYRLYKQYKENFEYFKNLHKNRYRLYFTEERNEKIEVYSNEIEEEGEYLIDIGKICIENNILSRRQMANVKEMLEQTERMMKNVKWGKRAYNKALLSSVKEEVFLGTDSKNTLKNKEI